MDELITTFVGAASGVAFLAFVLTLVKTGLSIRTLGFFALWGAFSILFITKI
jgi:hypothetical protein